MHINKSFNYYYPKDGEDQVNIVNHPVSLLCSISNIIEIIIFDEICKFVLPSLSASQFGFMKGRKIVFETIITYISTIYSNICDHNISRQT